MRLVPLDRLRRTDSASLPVYTRCVFPVVQSHLHRQRNRNTTAHVAPDNHTREGFQIIPVLLLLLYPCCSYQFPPNRVICPGICLDVPFGIALCFLKYLSIACIVFPIAIYRLISCLRKIITRYSSPGPGRKYPLESPRFKITVCCLARSISLRFFRSPRPVSRHNSPRVIAFSCPIGI